jgi:inosine-uridine nucleoside N-ribohydrolase
LAQRIVVDTDMGVDDALAVAWLLSQRECEVELIGVSAVWGNASVECAAANVRGVLGVLGRSDTPVVVGAAAPLHRKRSRIGCIVHGPDGLWGCAARTDTLQVTRDLMGFYKSVPADGAILLATGPLTNLAEVVRGDVTVLRRFERIVVLGGAKHEGAMTPVSETNFWHDPEAADIVLSARLPITLVTRDAHKAFVLTDGDIDALSTSQVACARFVAEPARRYARVTRRFGEALNFPDVVAAVVTVDPTVATDARPALVRVVSGRHPLTRGQSIIGITPNERLTMVDGGAAVEALIEQMVSAPDHDLRSAIVAALAREPENALVVLAVDAARIRASFMRAMTRGGP